MIAHPILSSRLQKIADLITPCSCVADIGTDHAYLPAYLCMTGVCQQGIASDLRAGPLERAAATLDRYGLASKIDLRLGGGLDTLTVNEPDAIVIAGMGGLMIAQIIQAGDEVFRPANQRLLQPMTNLPELREYLYQSEYTITHEYLAKEDQKIYNILSVTAGREPTPPSSLELYLGKSLLETRPEHSPAYFAAQKRKLQNMVLGLTKATDPAAAEKLTQCRELLEEMRKLEL